MFSKSKKAKSQRAEARAASEQLPVGAEAAIWSILEVIPDPRNHLALTRDPTAEVRLSPAAISEAMALAVTIDPVTIDPPESVAMTGPVAVPAARFDSSMDLDLDQIQTVAPDPAIDLRTRPAELAWALNHELDRPPTSGSRPAGIRWSADTAEVRLPSFSTPQTAKPAWPGDATGSDATGSDATVHPIESSPPATPADGTRYARGA